MRAMFKKFFAKFRIGLCYLLFALANIVFVAVIGICLILSLFGLRDYKKKINAHYRSAAFHHNFPERRWL